MLCAKLATLKDGSKFPCGQCANCKINKRREWQARLLLEAASHENGIFLTLTTADAGTPHVLRKDYLRDFFAALRENYPDLRYFGAGEYGTLTGRGHYHAHLFNNGLITKAHISQAWPFGRIHIGDTEPASLDYVLGYLLKNKQAPRWPVELCFPEFRIFSKGIAKHALPHLLIDGTELPREFKVFGRTWPIGRYLRDRAKKMGFTVSERRVVILQALEAKAMRSLLSRPNLTQEEIADLYRKFTDDRNLKSAELQKRAIRAAYMQNHGHVQKANKHETF